MGEIAEMGGGAVPAPAPVRLHDDLHVPIQGHEEAEQALEGELAVAAAQCRSSLYRALGATEYQNAEGPPMNADSRG